MDVTWANMFIVILLTKLSFMLPLFSSVLVGALDGQNPYKASAKQVELLLLAGLIYST